MMCLVSVHNDQGMSILTLTLGQTFQFLFSNPDGIESLLYSISLWVRPRRGRIVNHLFLEKFDLNEVRLRYLKNKILL